MWSALYPTQVQHNYISLFNQLYILLLLLKHMLDNQYLILYSIYKKRKQKKKKQAKDIMPCRIKPHLKICHVNSKNSN